MREGGTQTLILSLARLAPSPPVPLPADRTRPELAIGSRPALGPAHTYLSAYVAFGIGAFGVAVGATLGAITLSTTSNRDSVCHTRSTCPPSAQSNIAFAQNMALLSTVGFGVGAAGVLLGTYFALRPISTDSSSTGTAPRSGAVHPRIWPSVGFGSIGVAGTL